jgi:hypothetical protein
MPNERWDRLFDEIRVVTTEKHMTIRALFYVREYRDRRRAGVSRKDEGR